MAETRRRLLDVSALPRHSSGPSELTWWGNVGFMVIEGFTLIICGIVYLYLRRNFDSWPPLRTFAPDLTIPTLSLLALVIATVFAHLEGHAGQRLDVPAAKLWGVCGVVMNAVVLVMRWFELSSLNTRWDNDAYGSIVWFTLGFHATLLVLVFLEDFFYTLVTFTKGLDAKEGGHMIEKAEYAYFVLAIWVVMYIIIYLSPRFI